MVGWKYSLATLSAVFLCFTYQNDHAVTSFDWKNDQWDAAHLFCFYIEKLFAVFLCFTYQNHHSVTSFNWKNDQWNAAHLFCFYLNKMRAVLFGFIGIIAGLF